MEDNLKIIKAKDFDPKKHEREEIFHDGIKWVDFCHPGEAHYADRLIVVREKPKAWTADDVLDEACISYNKRPVINCSYLSLAEMRKIINHLNETGFELDD